MHSPCVSVSVANRNSGECLCSAQGQFSSDAVTGTVVAAFCVSVAHCTNYSSDLEWQVANVTSNHTRLCFFTLLYTYLISVYVMCSQDNKLLEGCNQKDSGILRRMLLYLQSSVTQ